MSVDAFMNIQDNLVIKSELEAVTSTRHWAGQYAREAQFDTESVYAIELAVGEALTNIIRHAYQNEPGHEIHLALIIDETKFSLSIRDFGRKFNPTEHAPPDLSTPSEGGYGVYLIDKVMDEVTYDTSQSKGTRLDLVKYRPGTDKN